MRITMDNLPEEIINIIASFLSGRPLAPLAILSRRWQRVVERYTFSRLHIDSRDEDMESFARIVTPIRRAYIRYLKFAVVLPFSGSKNTEMQHYNEAFTGAMYRLFQLLAREKPGDVNEETDACDMTLEIGEVKDYGEKRRFRHRFELLHDGRQLPEVNRVSRLVFHRGPMDHMKVITLRTAVDLAQRLPYLRSIDIIAGDLELTGPAGQDNPWHLKDREALAAAVVESNFPSHLQYCRDVHLSLEWQDPFMLSMNPRFVFPNCVNPLSYEVLGSAMRTWSHNLTSLDISGVFDGSLFWPSEHELSLMPASPWPRLRYFHAWLGMTTPTGAWYFVPKLESSPRNTPCEDTMHPLLESWAKALESMPVLEHASIRFRVELETLGTSFASETGVEDWAIGFHAPGTNRSLKRNSRKLIGLGEIPGGADYSQKPRLVFRNVGGWRPRKLVLDKLHALGEDRFPSGKMVDLEVDMFNNVIET
ncbi:hypothetical protein K449DRAFT_239300 [Hypoxylon sp. EC38]|nr:hypothetical protein K449DRAFT_239300 [Hypoxylon sp. EC38]